MNFIFIRALLFHRIRPLISNKNLTSRSPVFSENFFSHRKTLNRIFDKYNFVFESFRTYTQVDKQGKLKKKKNYSKEEKSKLKNKRSNDEKNWKKIFITRNKVLGTNKKEYFSRPRDKVVDNFHSVQLSINFSLHLKVKYEYSYNRKFRGNKIEYESSK